MNSWQVYWFPSEKKSKEPTRFMAPPSDSEEVGEEEEDEEEEDFSDWLNTNLKTWILDI